MKIEEDDMKRSTYERDAYVRLTPLRNIKRELNNIGSYECIRIAYISMDESNCERYMYISYDEY